MIESTLPITGIRAVDVRFPLPKRAGSDARNPKPTYGYGVTVLETDRGVTGVGLAFTHGAGNKQLCALIERLGARLVGREVSEVMAAFGTEFKAIADDPRYMALGPHKGLVHLAVSSITNACFDLWAKAQEVPLWRLLLDLTPEQLVSTMDLSYVEDALTAEQARELLTTHAPTRSDRTRILDAGYPAYDASPGWLALSDDSVVRRAKEAVAAGYQALQLQVGSKDEARDSKRSHRLRSLLGESIAIMIDAGQAWDTAGAINNCRSLASMQPYWIDEPIHADDLLGHALIARQIAPTPLAAGGHIPNRVLFKQLLQLDAVHFIRADAVRLGGVSEFLTVSMLAKKYGKPVAPHAGDMGQIHQHLMLFNRIALDHEVVFLEHNLHVREHFLRPAIVEAGVYWTPEEPGGATDVIIE